MSPQPAQVFTVPEPIREVCERFHQAGHSAWLVGESLFEHWLGNAPPAFQMATSAPTDLCLRLHATAVPTRLEADTVTIATNACPVDVTPYRNGDQIEADLAVRGFSVDALAFDPRTEKWLDPRGGRDDAKRGRLRAVGDANDRLRENPLRAIRAAELWGRSGLQPDDALLEALRASGPSLRQTPAMALRWHLSRLVTMGAAEAVFARLHELDLANALFPGADPAHVAGLDALPEDLSVRLTWALRGTRGGRALRRLGFGRITASRVQELLAYHPIDCRVKGGSESAVRRLLRRHTKTDLEALVRMRECELERMSSEDAKPGREGLDTLNATIDRVRQADARSDAQQELALRGRDVMVLLDLQPGPRIGDALDFLAALVARDPALNEAAILRERLLEWARERQ